MSSELKKGKKKEDATPEALLEHLKKAMSSDDSSDDFLDLFENLSHLILRVINKSDADVATKIQATLYMGQLSGRFYVLWNAYMVDQQYDTEYKQELRDEMEDVLKKLIEVYAYLKKGGSLKNAIHMISETEQLATDEIEEYMYHLGRMLEDLSPEPYY